MKYFHSRSHSSSLFTLQDTLSSTTPLFFRYNSIIRQLTRFFFDGISPQPLIFLKLRRLRFYLADLEKTYICHLTTTIRSTSFSLIFNGQDLILRITLFSFFTPLTTLFFMFIKEKRIGTLLTNPRFSTLIIGF